MSKNNIVYQVITSSGTINSSLSNLGQVYVSSSSDKSGVNFYYYQTEQEQLIEYIDLLYQILGVDITFEKWKKLSVSEKTSLIREIKINKII